MEECPHELPLGLGVRRQSSTLHSSPTPNLFIMNYHFTECTHTPEVFFSILPEDWRASIVPCWPAYRDTARIFVLKSDEGLLGGGIVFATVSPDTQAYRSEAQSWFDRGYLYIGFLWIVEAHRGKQLGARWLEALKAQFPNKKFWLAIEEEGLMAFYRRNGFEVAKMVETGEGREWVMAEVRRS